jgi:hypothetical protein
MKNLIMILAAFSLVLIMGCQENLINEPAGTIPFQKDNFVVENAIKICCEIQDPKSGMCNLSGCVNYVHQVLNWTQNPKGLYKVLLRLQMDSKLCDKLGMVHLEWRAEGKSDDILYVSEEGILLLEKCYSITNRSDVVLLVQYLVTTNGVGISGISLAPLEQKFLNNNYKEY